MISSGLSQWQKSRKYRLDGDTVYGVANGVGFSIGEEDGGKLAIFMLVCSADSSFDRMEDMLRGQGELSALQVGDVEGYLALFYDESIGEMDDFLMDDMLNFVADNYRSLGFRAPNVCVKCGAPANKRSFYNNMVQPMCAECSAANRSGSQPSRAPAPAAPERLSTPTRYDEDRDDTYSGMERGRTRSAATMSQNWDAQPPYQANDNVGEGSMGMGVVGALLGALAGLVPFGISLLCNFPLSALCVLSGILAVLGYVAFKGVRVKQTGSLISILMAVLVSVIAVFACLKVIGGGSSSTIALLIHCVLGALGAFLGIALSIDALNKYTQNN